MHCSKKKKHPSPCPILKYNKRKSVATTVGGTDKLENMKLYCRETGEEIPLDEYTRRGHFIGYSQDVAAVGY